MAEICFYLHLQAEKLSVFSVMESYGENDFELLCKKIF